MKFLKGNYRLPDKPGDRAQDDQGRDESVTDEFERRALEKLGGSIAFVTKKGTLLWNPDKK